MHVSVKQIPGFAFLAYPEMCKLLLSEVSERFPNYGKPVIYNDLVYYPEAVECVTVPYWCRTAMIKPLLINFESIGEAAKTLKDIQRNWAPYQYNQFRRTTLIQEKLPYINLKTRTFPCKIPTSDIGLYMLINEHEMLASAETTSYFPAGGIVLEEDHVNPPSRAYLKLQEALIRFVNYFGEKSDFPKTGDKCFDAGACPGGWTYVLRSLGCTVTAIDRAPLADSLMEDKEVTFITHDAFTLKPTEMGEYDWVFSDVICYPERLYEWVNTWLDSGLCKKMICTIKMQGSIDWPLVEKFANIPNSKVVHLCYNKHELTWMHCE